MSAYDPPTDGSTRLPFPSVIDSTMLNAWRSCPTKFMYEYIRRLRPRGGKSIDLIAGGAIAAGLQTARLAHFRDHASAEEAAALGLGALLREYGDPLVPERSAKTWERVAGVYEAYLDRYPLDRDIYYPLIFVEGGKPAIEFSFGIPISIKHPESGDPIVLAGRFDMMAGMRKFPDGSMWKWEDTGARICVDEKSTSRMGDRWAEQWDLRAQFMCYQWACAEFGYHVEGLVVRGLCILKTEYKFAEKIVYNREWKIARWLWQTKRDIRRMIESWRAGEWDLDLGDACNSYSGCPFRRLCETENPEPWIPMYYEHNDWNPLKQDESEE